MISILYRLFFFKSVCSINISPLYSSNLIALFFIRLSYSYFALDSHFPWFLSFVVLQPLVILLKTASSFTRMFYHLTVHLWLIRKHMCVCVYIYVLFEYLYKLVISSVFLILTSVYKHINISPNCSRAVCFESAAQHHINPT